MGILASILGTGNPLAQWTLQNHGLLSSWGQGLASGPTIEQGLSNAVQQGPAGQLIDQQYQKAEQDKADREAKIKQSSADLAKWPDLVKYVTDTGDTAGAFGEAFKRSSPGYGDPNYGKAPVDPTSTYAGRLQAGKEQGLTGTELGNYALTGRMLGQDGSGSTADIQNFEYGQKHPDFVSYEGQKGGAALSPAALQLAAEQYIAGDKTVLQGYSRNSNMRAQLANAVAEMANANGMDGKALAAEISAYGGNVAAQRAAGTRAAQVGMAASEANQMADIALTASKAVPRGTFVPWNAAVNAVSTNTSSPEMAQFVTATTSLVNAYARAVSPLGAPTDAMRQHAEAMLNTAQGPDAYAAVIAQMKKEMEAALNAPAEVSDRLKTNITGQPSAPVGGGSDPDVEQILKGVGL